MERDLYILETPQMINGGGGVGDISNVSIYYYRFLLNLKMRNAVLVLCCCVVDMGCGVAVYCALSILNDGKMGFLNSTTFLYKYIVWYKCLCITTQFKTSLKQSDSCTHVGLWFRVMVMVTSKATNVFM